MQYMPSINLKEYALKQAMYLQSEQPICDHTDIILIDVFTGR